MRRAGVEAFATTLERCSPDASEVEIRQALHHSLSTSLEGVSDEGWYRPPPMGVIVAAGNPPSYERVGVESYRPEHTWPSADVKVSGESVLYVYASRVDLMSGALGDFGCSVYLGDDPLMIAFQQEVWNATMCIARGVRVGMTFSDIYRMAIEILRQASLDNEVFSAHNGATTNVGHSLPWSDVPMTREERDIVNGADPDELSKLISAKRRFVSPTDESVVDDCVLFTIEPRLSREGFPQMSFHVVVGVRNGEPVVLADFEPLAKWLRIDTRL